MTEMLTTLPADVRAPGETYTLSELQAIFATHSLDARGGYSEEVALAKRTVDLDGVRWLLDHGADIEAESKFGSSPLGSRLHARQSDVAAYLIGRGADIHRVNSDKKPLIIAAGELTYESVELLLAQGADVHATDAMRWNALSVAVIRVKPHTARATLAMAKLLVAHGSVLDERTHPEMRKSLTSAYRAEGAGNRAAETELVLEELLAMFDVDPPARPRVLAEGEPITVTTTGWKKQYSELWKMLVPSGGRAKSAQGELVRIIGQIGYELKNNGGGNWDSHFEALRADYGAIVRTGTPLPEASLIRVDSALEAIAGGRYSPEAIDILTQESVAWVEANPVRFPPPATPFGR